VSEALILLHGFTNTGRSWNPVIEALGERYRAIAPDIRGHGDASDFEPVSLAGVLEDVGALVPGPFTLAGYSMGGRLALHAALAMPERVRRLVLIGASPGLADPNERAARLEDDRRLADEIEGLSIEQFASLWARTPVLAGQPPWIREDRLRSSVSGLARALRGLGTGALPPVWDRLGELSMPVVLVVGERDAKFAAIAERMAAAIPDASLVVVPGAGHAVHLEQPEAVAELL
jgi:2-succinyl-6-hydroxy-2,4-cyclohexadiene-1-carboxylate synthase